MKKGKFFLFLCAFIWGFCLVGQSTGMEFMGPLSFSAVRLTLGGFSLVVLSLILDGIKKKNGKPCDTKKEYKEALAPGLICMGFILATMYFQQYGLLYTGVGKCAFITAFYIFLVPLFGIFFKKKVTGKVWISVVLAMIGLYMITMSSGFDSVNKGDIICLGAAIMYSIYILVVEKVGGDIDTIKFSAVQFTACGLISFVFAVIFEPGQITWTNYINSIWPIIITGIISCAVGYTCQLIGQKDTDPNTASMILSSETVFSLFAGMIFLNEVLTGKEYIGCFIMVIAIAISVIPGKGKVE